MGHRGKAMRLGNWEVRKVKTKMLLLKAQK
jgi:hypothetical protein